MNQATQKGNQPNTVTGQFERFLNLQSELCDELEKVADNLPDLPDNHACLELAQRMLPLIKRAHQFEEQKVWPILKNNPQTSELNETLSRLSFEHWGDEDFAEQVFHQLRGYVQSPKREKADGLAWTLRGFFQNMQRHISFEREVLLPMICKASSAIQK